MTISDICELLVSIPDVFKNWRFYLSLLLSLGATAAIYWLVPDPKIALVFSVIL